MTEKVYPQNITRVDPADAVPVGAPPPELEKGRVTEVAQIYFEQPGEEPVGFDFRVSREVPKVSEEPFSRRIEIGESWSAPDFGWLNESAGVLIIESQAGKNLATNPTAEEKAEIGRQIIEIGVIAPDETVVAAALVHPGGFQVLEPPDAGAVRVRCQHGTTKARLAVLPGK